MLWQATPGVGLSAADERAPVLAFLARNPGLSLVVEVDGTLAATVLVGHDSRRGYTHHLTIAASYQRRSFTRQLIDRARSAFALDGIVQCDFHAFADNAPARAFWSRLDA